MDWLLLTNDDGVDSPALRPFASALSRSHDVRVVVPAEERSWSGKAISRFASLRATALDGGLVGWAHTGLPADGVQLGAGPLYDTRPGLVVSGINIGYNHGAGYLWSSGTVGAAVEAWTLGLPSVAFSTGEMSDWLAWKDRVNDRAGWEGWPRLADTCAKLLDEIIEVGLHLHADVVNVNLPFDADGGTERRLTTVARTGYGTLFRENGGGEFVHEYDGLLVERGPLAGSDVEAAFDGVISITALRMPTSIATDTGHDRLIRPSRG